MSNSSLQAEVYRLESILADVQRENARLSGEIQQGVSTVNQANRAVSDFTESVGQSLNRSANNVINAQNLEERAYQVQLETEKLYPLFKNMEDANKNIRDLNNKKYYEFVQYRIVRKIMQGFMENLDLNLVQDELIYKAVEKSQLQTPDFWLTSAMTAIMAWKNDRKDLADRAILQAWSLDKKNTAVFFFIFNLRMGREETAVKWLLEYEKCGMTGEDKENFLMMFSLVSRTMHENVRPEIRDRITGFVTRTIRQSRESEGYSEEELIRRIAARLMTLRTAQTYNTPNLAQSMGGYADLTDTIDMAANNYTILDRLTTILSVPVSERNLYLREFMNRLLTRPNDVERETYEQIQYYEMVIRKKGDVSAAAEAFHAAKQEESSEINLVSYMVDWVADDSNESINGQMRRNMFTLIADSEQRGIQRYADIYRSRYKEVWPLKIGEYETTCDFRNYNEESRKIGLYFQQWLEGELAKISNKSAFILFGLAVVLIAAGIYFRAYIPAAIAALVCAAAGGLTIFFNKKKKENLAVEAENRTAKTTQQLQILFNEFNMLRQTFIKYDAVTRDIDEVFTRI